MSMQQGDSSIGQIIDGYRILEVLGKGGMGIVYKAEDIALSRAVAIKMIAPELSSNESFLRRFQSEARALARVESPFIVGVHALRKVEDSFFIVMEFIDGWTLADEIEKGALEFSRARIMLKQMLQAFARAHSVGVIHRDIKPRNIMITGAGRVKVTDFGLAKLRRDDGKSTVTQGMAGTARYMSPEQVLGSQIDHRSDIYSLGMTMYEMLAGVLPFGAEEGTFSILKRIVEEDLPSPVKYNPHIPEALVEVILKATRKDPAQRFQSAQEMLDEMEIAFKLPKPAPAIASPPPAQFREDSQAVQKKTNRKPLAIAAVALLLLLAYPVFKFITNENDGASPPNISERPEERQPASNPQVQLARLTISTMPAGATVYVNRDSIGVASGAGLEYEVPEGDVNLAVHMAGYEKIDTMITVNSESSNIIALPLEPISETQRPVDQIAEQQNSTNENESRPAPPPTGTVKLVARPAGLIFVNGRSYQDSLSMSLPAGSHRVRFEDRKTGVSMDATVTVNAGGSTARTCYFQHSLTVQTRDGTNDPPWATIYINGEDIDWPTPLDDYPLYPGEYTVSLKRSGYVLSDPQRLVISPTFDVDETTHILFFNIAKEQE